MNDSMSSVGGMKVTGLNGVKVYTIAGQRSFPSWIDPSKRRSLRKDEDYMRRIELLQDLQFDAASTRIKATPDGKFLISTGECLDWKTVSQHAGTYPPQVKVYELSELSLKFERHLISEIIDFQTLNDDYSKLAFLCADRSVCLHAKFGSYFSTRIPRMGRDLAYDSWSCDLVVAASSPDIYRLNLEEGRFLVPLQSRSPGVNVLGRSPIHGLIACGGEDGAIECFDPRQKASVGRIDVVGNPGNEGQEVTALRYDDRDGMLLAAGTSSGQVLLYDLRSSTPVYIKDHLFVIWTMISPLVWLPIIDIKWHQSVTAKSRHLVTSDTRVLRIWDPETGNGLTSIEAPMGAINDVCVYPASGVLFMALDSPRISSYFVPALGPAPRWCSFLENLTEELEESAQTVIYDDYKFLTRKELEQLNLTNLLGSNLLRAYMHGFFIDHRLYAKAKALANPFAYEDYRRQRVQQKMEADRAARITVKKKLPKVNKELATRLLAASEKKGEGATGEDGEIVVKGKGSTKLKSPGESLLQDERFSAMFTDETFQVDEDAAEFRSLHPNVKKAAPVDEHFDLVSDDGEESSESAGNNSNSEDDSSSEDGKKKNAPDQRKSRDAHKEGSKNAKSKSDVGMRLYEAKDEVHAQAFRNNVSLAASQSLPLQDRVQEVERTVHHEGTRVQGLRGSREISFNPGKSNGNAFNRNIRQKRSIQSLGLSNDKPRSFSGQGGGRGRGRGRGGVRNRGRGRGRA